jgi:hypothetical protein
VDFREWFAGHATTLKLDPDPDSGAYDYRAAYRAGSTPDASGHWPSQFKQADHWNRYVDDVDTITGKAAPNPYRDIIARLPRPDVASAARDHAATTPDKRAEAQRLSKRHGGTPVPVVERNLEAVRAVDKQREYADLLARAPKLAAWIAADYETSGAAADDLDTLTQLEDHFWMMGAFLRASDTVGELVGGFEEWVGERGRRNAELMDSDEGRLLGDDFHEALVTRGRTRRERNAVERARRGPDMQLADVDPTDPASVAKYVAETLIEQGPIIIPMVAAGAAGGVGAAALGFKASIGAAIGAFTVGEVFGIGAVQSATKAADPEAVAPNLVFLGGTAVAALDMVTGLRWGGRLVRAFGRETAEEIAQRALVAPLKPQFITATGKAILSDAPAEAITEGAQAVVEELFAAAATEQKDFSLADVVRRLPEEMIAGALGGGAFGGGTAAVAYRGEAARFAASQQQQAFFEGLAQGATESKTAKRSPTAFEAYVASATRGTLVESLHAPTDTFRQYWTDRDVHPDLIAAELTGHPEALAEAEAAGADLVIPTATYAAKLAGTEHHAFFANELKVDPLGHNVRELAEGAQQLQETAQALLALRQEVEAVPLVEGVGPAETLGPIAGPLAQQLQGDSGFLAMAARAGVEATTASRAYAANVAQIYTVMAQRMGTTPEALFARFPLAVGPDTATVPQDGVPIPPAPVTPAVEEDVPEGAQTLYQGDRPTFTGPRLPRLEVSPASVIDGRPRLSTRQVTAVEAPAAPEGTVQRTDLSVVLQGQGTARVAPILERYMETIRTYPQLPASARAADPRGQVEAFIEQGVENLRWLWHLASEEMRERARTWYVGAHRIMHDLADDYGVTDQQAAAVVAILSPQMDWFKNVDLGRRVFTQYFAAERDNPVFTTDLFKVIVAQAHTARPGLVKKARARVAAAGGNLAAQDRAARAVVRSQQQEVAQNRKDWVGVARRALPLDGQARLLRVLDETTAPRSYRVILPEGEDGDFARTKAGAEAKVGWGGYDAIAGAISVLRDGSMDSISHQLSTEHKVRSFYNNIIDPWNPDAVTIDTHSVAATHLEPFSQASPEVMFVMGGPSDNLLGLSGANPLYAEMHFRLAAELGVLPREVQSVTWEVARGLFAPEQKRGPTGAKLAATVKALWKDHQVGNITPDEFHARLLTLAGGVTEPAWLHTPPRVALDEERLRAGYVQPLQPAVSVARGRGGLDPSGPPRRNTGLGAGPVRARVLTGRVQAGQGKAPQRVEYDDILRRIAEGGKKSGFTYAPVAGQLAADGFSVSTYGDDTQVFANFAAVTGTQFVDYVTAKAALLQIPGNHLGGWHEVETGRFFLDIVRVVETVEEALALGVAHEQIAVFDLRAEKEVTVVYPEGHVHDARWQGRPPDSGTEGGPADRGGAGGDGQGPERAGDVAGGARGNAGDLGARAAFDPVDPTTRTLFQGPRGRITFGADLQFRIALLSEADLSTFLHETGHAYLEMLRVVTTDLRALDPATLTETQRQMVADYGTFMAAVGGTPGTSLTVAQQEAFAELYETYLLQATAPTPALRDAFARLRTWMIQVYQRLTFAGLPLQPEVTAAFDRMVATQAEIDAAIQEAAIAPIFATPEEAGMSVLEFQAYLEDVRAESGQAQDRVQREAMQELRRERTAWWQAQAAAVRVEVARELAQDRVYAALDALTQPAQADQPPPLRLDKAAVVDGYGEAALVPGTYASEGVTPDAAAEVLGFTSGDELLNALAQAVPFEEAVAADTAARMRALHGDILADGRLRGEARKAVQSTEGRTRVINAELRAFRRRARQAKAGIAAVQAEDVAGRRAVATAVRQGPTDQQVRAEADRIIGLAKIRDLRPDTYWAAARRSAKEASEAALAGHYERAVAKKEQQRLAVELYRAANDARDEATATARYARRFETVAVQQRLGTAGPSYLQQILAILDKYEFVPVSARTLASRASLVNWLEDRAAEELPTEHIDAATIEAARAVNYRELSRDELRQVRDTVRQIEHLSRLKNRLLASAEARSFLAQRDTVVTSLAAHAPTKAIRVDETASETRLRRLKAVFAAHTKVATYARILDGGQDGGALWEAFIRPLNRAADLEADRRRVEGARLKAILDAHYPGGGRGWGTRRHIPAAGVSLTKETVLSVALNWGAVENRQRVLHEYSPAQVEAILGTLEARDWAYVRDVWAFLESFWDEVAAHEERITGLPPTRVERVAVTTPFGTLEGGYYPLQYDPRRSAAAGRAVAVSDAKLGVQAAGASMMTRHGHTMARRANVGQPLKFDMDVLFSHVDQVLHDLTHRETLIDLSRLLRDEQIAAALFAVSGDSSVFDQFRGVLEDIRVGHLPSGNGGDAGATFLRTGVQVSSMGWAAWSAMQQPLGLFNGMHRVGTSWVLQGLGRWLRDSATMESTVGWIHERSPMMRNRSGTALPELNEVRSELQREDSWFNALVRTTTGGRLNSGHVLDTWLWHIGQAQRIADVPTWLGAYEKAMAGGNDEARAVALADQAVLDSQGGGQIKDLAQVQRGGPMARAFLMFYSYGSVMFNQTRALRAGSSGPLALAQFLWGLSLLYILPAMMEVVLSRAFGRTEDDDGLFAEFAGNVLSTAMNTMMWVRELNAVGQYLTGAEPSRTYGGPAFTRAIQLATPLAQQVVQGELDEGLWKALNRPAGILVGYPSSQIEKTVNGWVALRDGRTDNPGVLLVGPSREARR